MTIIKVEAVDDGWFEAYAESRELKERLGSQPSGSGATIEAAISALTLDAGLKCLDWLER
jgi:hypothetical protein